MKKSKRNPAKSQPRFTVVGKQDQTSLTACLTDNQQLLLQLLELIQDAKASIDELMHDAARTLVEQLLVCSAEEIAGRKHPGKQAGEIHWHGTQQGRIVLAERKLQIKRPRLRNAAGEVRVPVYDKLRENPQLGSRVRDILVNGVSTRRYEQVLPPMAGTVGVKKSSVSAAFVKASAQALEEFWRS